MSVSGLFAGLRNFKPTGRRTPIQSRRDLRPLDWHLIWPELAEQDDKEAAHG